MSTSAEAIQEHHLVQISVNNRPVRIEGPKATGLEIKEAAIAQGVPIQVSFQLSEKLGDHKTKIIGNTDSVTLHEGAVFVAVADDDNS
jgi:hypothetical protein